MPRVIVVGSHKSIGIPRKEVLLSPIYSISLSTMVKTKIEKFTNQFATISKRVTVHFDSILDQYRKHQSVYKHLGNFSQNRQ